MWEKGRTDLSDTLICDVKHNGPFHRSTVTQLPTVESRGICSCLASVCAPVHLWNASVWNILGVIRWGLNSALSHESQRKTHAGAVSAWPWVTGWLCFCGWFGCSFTTVCNEEGQFKACVLYVPTAQKTSISFRALSVFKTDFSFNRHVCVSLSLTFTLRSRRGNALCYREKQA